MIKYVLLCRYSQKSPVSTERGFLNLRLKSCLYSHFAGYTTDFVGANAAGANFNGFVLTAGQNHFAFLQVGVLEEAVVLVGEANFVGFVATLGAYFTNAGHDEGKSFTLVYTVQVLPIEPLKKWNGNTWA